MRNVFGFKLALIASLASVSVAQAQTNATCWKQAETDAARVRNVQTVLMIAALECKTSSFAADRLYNDFVAKNRSTLQGHNDALRSYFFRASGEVEGRRAYDRFTTSLANRQSREAYDNTQFCRNAEMLGRLAIGSDPRGVLALASDMEERPYGVGASCDEGAARPLMREAVLPEVDRYGPVPLAAPVEDDDRAAPSPSVSIADPVAAPAMVAPLAAPEPIPQPVAHVEVVAPSAILEPAVMPAVAVVAPAAERAPAPKVIPVAARADPAAALAAAAEALKLAAEAMRDANAAPADAAPVIHERVTTKKL